MFDLNHQGEIEFPQNVTTPSTNSHSLAVALYIRTSCCGSSMSRVLLKLLLKRSAKLKSDWNRILLAHSSVVRLPGLQK